jgi:hypothetical protein
MDKNRDVKIKVEVEDMYHCSDDCRYLDHSQLGAQCDVFGPITFDKSAGLFARLSECFMGDCKKN